MDIIPLSLKRRIKRLIKIDDIFTNETPTPIEQSESTDLLSQSDGVYVEPRLEPKPLYETKRNWINEFCQKTRKDRIIWNSKMHQSSRLFANKPIYEQIEQLLDASAENVAECINKLTDDEQNQISKEIIKKFFSIEIDNDISHSIFVHKIHRPYVSEEIAELFDCPELAIERNIRKLMKTNKKSPNILPKYYAFDKCLSPTSKQVQRTKFTEEEPFNFPDDIRSGENLFHGIEYLKSTYALMAHLDKHNLPKPTYLIKMHALNAKSKNTNHTPLYSFYQ